MGVMVQCLALRQYGTSRWRKPALARCFPRFIAALAVDVVLVNATKEEDASSSMSPSASRRLLRNTGSRDRPHITMFTTLLFLCKMVFSNRAMGQVGVPSNEWDGTWGRTSPGEV